MEKIENAAYVSVGRACGFAGLAVFCVTIGLSFQPALAARVGGVLSLAVAIVLGFCAFRALNFPYKRTELWLILDKKARISGDIAQRVIGGILRETYLWFGQQAALIAVVLLGLSIILQITGLDIRWGES